MLLWLSQRASAVTRRCQTRNRMTLLSWHLRTVTPPTQRAIIWWLANSPNAPPAETWILQRAFTVPQTAMSSSTYESSQDGAKTNLTRYWALLLNLYFIFPLASSANQKCHCKCRFTEYSVRVLPLSFIRTFMFTSWCKLPMTCKRKKDKPFYRKHENKEVKSIKHNRKIVGKKLFPVDTRGVYSNTWS